MRFFLLGLLCIVLSCTHSDALASVQGKKVLVLGATGRVGRLVVQDLLQRDGTLSVRCVVRDKKKASEVLPMEMYSSRLSVVQGDLSNAKNLKEWCKDVDAAVWCATGFSDATSNVNKVLGLLRLKFSPATTVDVAALSELGGIMDAKKCAGLVPDGPAIVICSSAGVTRTTWSEEKKRVLVGAADIPIVRLNPLNILDVKRTGEEALRKSCKNGKYAIVRPCGLNDKTPPGRPLLSQGDVAVGRISRLDAAKLLVDTLYEPQACGKTYEALALPGFPYSRGFADQLSRLKKDSDPPAELSALFGQYALLQQIIPGETMRPNELAMGQTYEQLDKSETGRLGVRGSEQAPLTRS